MLHNVEVAAPFGVCVAVGLALVVEDCAPVFIKTQISPVASELMKIRPWSSRANPTGLKHEAGHFELSRLLNMSVNAVVLSEAATGDPFAKAIVDNL
jgi:hypothetical protein